jgi:hypothetical protein
MSLYPPARKVEILGIDGERQPPILRLTNKVRMKIHRYPVFVRVG